VEPHVSRHTIFFQRTIKVQLEAYWTSTMDESSHRMQLLVLPMIY
jgi:hypothetical protein